MYNFVDVGGRSSAGLPLVYMMIDGSALEDEIEGYRTLNVSGRETVQKRLETETVKGLDGELLLGSNYKARTLSVEYQLIADDPEGFQLEFSRLKKLLSRDELQISFSDQPDFFYIGCLDQMQEVPKGLNAITSSIEFFCPSPFLFGRLKTINNGERLVHPDVYKVQIERLKIVPASDTNQLTVSNGRQQIMLKGSFKANDLIELDLSDQAVYQNGNLKMTLLDLRSDFENFELVSGEAVRLEQSGSVTAEYREVQL